MNADDPGSDAGPSSGNPDNNQPDNSRPVIHRTVYNHLLSGKDEAEGLIHHTALDRVMTGKHQAEVEYYSGLSRSSRRAAPTFTKTMIKESMGNPGMRDFLADNPDRNIQETALRRDMIARQKFGDFYYKYDQGTTAIIASRTGLLKNARDYGERLAGR